jgi:hypothetical protein
MKTRTIFAVQHDPRTRIGVTHEPGPDDSKGLVVSVYRTLPGSDELARPQRFRYWNPVDVGPWFSAWSPKNLDGWVKAYHSSGLTGADFNRPAGSLKDVQIVADYRAVPYKTQRDNERFASGACNVTSCAIPIDFYNLPTIETEYAQIEDNLELYMSRRKLDRHYHLDLATMMRAHGLNNEYRTGVTLDELRDELKRGSIVIVSGAFTGSGHIVCVIGTENADFVVHDPWGDYNATDKRGRHYRNDDGTYATNGAFRIYSEATMRDVLITKRAGRGPIWSHFVRPPKS